MGGDVPESLVVGQDKNNVRMPIRCYRSEAAGEHEEQGCHELRKGF